MMPLEQQPRPKPVKVLYVVCHGRSGSTLLNLMLGAHSELLSIGELGTFAQSFRNKAPEKMICTCRKHLAECEFWVETLTLAKERFGEDISDLDAADDDVFAAQNHALMSAALDISGKTWLIDKSKKPGRLARLLARPDLFDVTTLHVIRDGRAVANSFRRRGIRKNRANRRKFNYYWVCFRWDLMNFQTLRAFGRHPNYIRVRYEDIVSDPEDALRSVQSRLGLDVEMPQQLEYWTQVHHDFSGNRMRLHGHQGIKKDTTYLELTPRQWWAGTALALPGLLAFRYPLLRPSTKGGGSAPTPDHVDRTTSESRH